MRPRALRRTGGNASAVFSELSVLTGLPPETPPLTFLEAFSARAAADTAATMGRRALILCLLLLGTAWAHEGHDHHAEESSESEESSEESSTEVTPTYHAPDPSLLKFLANAPHTDVVLSKGGKEMVSLAWLVRGGNITFVVQSLDNSKPNGCVDPARRLRMATLSPSEHCVRSGPLTRRRATRTQGGGLRFRDEDAEPLRMCVGRACSVGAERAQILSPTRRCSAADIAWMDGDGKGHVRNYHISGAVCE